MMIKDKKSVTIRITDAERLGIALMFKQHWKGPAEILIALTDTYDALQMEEFEEWFQYPVDQQTGQEVPRLAVPAGGPSDPRDLDKGGRDYLLSRTVADTLLATYPQAATPPRLGLFKGRFLRRLQKLCPAPEKSSMPGPEGTKKPEKK